MQLIRLWVEAMTTGGATKKYKGRTYKIRTGDRGGKFILVGKEKKKIYV